MPFRTGARVIITNDGDTAQPQIYGKVNWEHWHAPPPPGTLYFHAHWRRAQPPLGEDFDILPHLSGRGRFLGAIVGVHANPAYTLPGHAHDPGTFWWSEGEVRIFLDGDGGQPAALTGPAAAEAHPTLAGTGGEDYFGTAWGLGRFTTGQAGCTVANTDLLLWSCYRFHVPDPIFFHSRSASPSSKAAAAPCRSSANSPAPAPPCSPSASTSPRSPPCSIAPSRHHRRSHLPQWLGPLPPV